MKRDIDLIRKLLKSIQDTPAGEKPNPLGFDEYGQATIYEHLILTIKAGLVEGQILGKPTQYEEPIIIERLSWKGHDFLDSSEDESIWAKAKETIIKPGVSFTFDLLWEWLKGQAREKIGLP
jgi:hypothetical protein